MAALSRVLRSIGSASGGHGICFWCPGCDGAHVVYYERPGDGPVWQWDGSVDRPTISPSILVTCNGKDVGTPGAPPAVCHSFVRDGKIEFLADCTHALAGQTVSLPDFPAGYSTS